MNEEALEGKGQVGWARSYYFDRQGNEPTRESSYWGDSCRCDGDSRPTGRQTVCDPAEMIDRARIGEKTIGSILGNAVYNQVTISWITLISLGLSLPHRFGTVAKHP